MSSSFERIWNTLFTLPLVWTMVWQLGFLFLWKEEGWIEANKPINCFVALSFGVYCVDLTKIDTFIKECCCKLSSSFESLIIIVSTICALEHAPCLQKNCNYFLASYLIICVWWNGFLIIYYGL